jgi:preprotein translocase subunit SecY
MAKRSPQASRPPANRPPQIGLPARLAITLLVPCSLALLQAIGLPGVDTSELPSSSTVARGSISAFGLGITPFIVAAVIVELAAALVPRWSALRLGGHAGRASLARSTALLGVVLAGFQAWSIAALLSSPPLQSLVGSIEPWHVVLTLVAGSSCLALLAALAGERALAGGVALLAAGAPIVIAGVDLARRARAPTLAGLVVLAFEAAGVIAATLLVLRPPRVAAIAEREATYRTVERPRAARAEIPAPASGLAPLVLTATLLVSPSWLSMFIPSLGGLAAQLTRDVVFVPVAAVLLALFTVSFGALFNRPERVAALRARGGTAARGYDALLAEARDELAPALVRSILFVGTLFFLGHLARRLGGELLEPGSIALAAALGHDIVTEIRARRATPELVVVWPEHRPYALLAAREALAEAGITVHARGEGLRRLLQLFGPYVPIELMVPPGDAARATEILTELLLARPGDARATAGRSDRGSATARIAAKLRGE